MKTIKNSLHAFPELLVIGLMVTAFVLCYL